MGGARWRLNSCGDFLARAAHPAVGFK